ncbi:MAG: ATP F0F1 synthase subunit B [Parvularculaceae bacterium]
MGRFTAIAAEAAAEGGSLPQADFSTWPSQLFWLAVTFGALYWIMSSSILPRLGGAIEERRDRIADDLDQAAEHRRQADEAEAAYERALADARAKAQAIAAETRAELEAEIAEMQKTADAEAAARLAEAEARIDAMKAEASSKVREAAADVAKAIVATLIDETPTDEAAANAVSDAARTGERCSTSAPRAAE